MEAVALPLPDMWEALPAEAQMLFLALRTHIAALQAENVALQTRIRDPESRLGQDSFNSARLPSSNPPQAAAKGKRQAVRTGPKRGGQPGHPGTFRSL